MTLDDILKIRDANRHMTSDSRQVKKGSVFVAYRGERADGRDYILEAIKNGAAAVVWERDGFDWDDENKLPNLGVINLRH